VDFEIITNKGKYNSILYEKKFHKLNFEKYLNVFEWKCVSKTCNARVYLNKNVTEIFKNNENHQNNYNE